MKYVFKYGDTQYYWNGAHRETGSPIMTCDFNKAAIIEEPDEEEVLIFAIFGFQPLPIEDEQNDE